MTNSISQNSQKELELQQSNSNTELDDLEQMIKDTVAATQGFNQGSENQSTYHLPKTIFRGEKTSIDLWQLQPAIKEPNTAIQSSQPITEEIPAPTISSAEQVEIITQAIRNRFISSPITNNSKTDVDQETLKNDSPQSAVNTDATIPISTPSEKKPLSWFRRPAKTTIAADFLQILAEKNAKIAPKKAA